MKQQFLQEYEATVDEIFSYYFERTYDRGKSIDLVREHFMKNWNAIARGKSHTLRSESVVESTNSEIAPKASNTLIPLYSII